MKWIFGKNTISLYIYLLSIRKNNFTTSLRRRYLTSLWSCHIVDMEASDDVAKTTSLQCLLMTSLNKTLQRRRFCNVVQHFHGNYIATSEGRWTVTSQQRCNDVTGGALVAMTLKYYKLCYLKLNWSLIMHL